MKILVVDDHPMVRDAMAHMVTQLDTAVEVLEAPDCEAAVSAAAAHPDLDLVLLDLHLPGLHGVAALERFRREHPGAPIVVVSAVRDRELVRRALAAGAMGFIPKSSTRETFVEGLRTVLAGSIYIPPDIAPHAAALEAANTVTTPGDVMRPLTARQRQVLALIMRGRSNKEICRELKLAERTVKVHLTAVLNALKVTNRTQAVIAASQLGLDPDSLLQSPAGDSAD